MFGQPRALFYLAGTEFWDCVSFRGMQALLVLYMVDELLVPEHINTIFGFHGLRDWLESVDGSLTPTAFAAQLFGLYVGLAYFTPVIGGYLGDRYLGRRAAVILGAGLMTAGHACMVFERTFLIALLLLILGAGFLRGNLAPQVGALYEPNDGRRAVGFQVYFLMINAGIAIAPVITGSLAAWASYRAGLAVAGFGMLAGLIVYVRGLHHLPPEPARRKASRSFGRTPADKAILLNIMVLLPPAILFWIAQAQIWNMYNLWARNHLDLTVGQFVVPVPWLQGFDSLCVVVLSLPLIRLFRLQARRGNEPDELTKMAIGCCIFGLSLAWLAASHLWWPLGANVPLSWAVVFHLLSNVGYLYFAPTALALVSRVSPAEVNGLMIGVYLLSVFVGSTVSGRLGSLYESLTPAVFWLIHSLVAFCAGVLIVLIRPSLLRRLNAPQMVLNVT